MDLHIDLETFSSVNLKDCGMYKYVESPDFEILLFCYAFGNDPVQTVDLAQGDYIPQKVVEALLDPWYIKKAFNAPFEINCLQKLLGYQLDIRQWRCVMVKALMLGLPGNLLSVSAVLNLELKKQDIGKQLIRVFCIPRKPSKNDPRTRLYPKDEPEKWQQFREYCVYDVESEREVDHRIAWFPIPAIEQRLWELDQKINNYGILIDDTLVRSAIHIDKVNRTELKDEAIALTGLANPNSVAQLKDWLELEIDETVRTLSKDAVHDLLKTYDTGTVNRVLQIRQMTSKSSIKKFTKMLQMAVISGRMKGLLQYYGANRTGRWAGRGVQPHNFAKNKMKRLDLARKIMRMGDYDIAAFSYPDISDVLSQLLRPALVAPAGHTLLMADFSAIEARVIAWLANERWRLKVFATHGKIYEASASAMFKVAIELCGKGSTYREKGKIAELALGFQGAVGALIRMGAEKMGLTLEELPELVRLWRLANPAIVQMWYDIQDAAIECVRTGMPQETHYLKYFVHNNVLFCKLPSGRVLSYLRPTLKVNEKGYDSLWYYGIDQTTHQWKLIPTYGGKLVENAVQAIARDALSVKMLEADRQKFCICFHVHDEIVCETLDDEFVPLKLQALTKIMGEPVSWAPGLPLAADAYASPFYRKED